MVDTRTHKNFGQLSFSIQAITKCRDVSKAFQKAYKFI